jgi:2-polyprenyl-3-methyl-5-hydroxy-6-metoxy-1,4-benzoquinol methylase
MYVIEMLPPGNIKNSAGKPHTCPACRIHEDFAHVVNVEDQGENFNLFRCSKCGLLFVHPIPEVQTHFHGELIWKPAEAESTARAKRNHAQHLLNACQQNLSPGARIFDFACGKGHFLAVASKAGYYVEGTDISPGNRKYIAKYLPDVIVYSELSEMPADTEKFDLVTAFEILYYMPSAIETLRMLQKLLRPGGTIFLSASANRGWLIWLLSCMKGRPLKLKQRDWITSALLNGIAYYAFSTRSLVRFLESAGFTDVCVVRLSSQQTKGLSFDVPLFLWRLCTRVLYVLTLGKLDMSTRAHVLGRYVPSEAGNP